jgi:hypothetical protein
MTLYLEFLQAMYFWPEDIKRRLSRSEYFTDLNRPQIRLMTAVLIMLVVLCEFISSMVICSI